MEGIMAEFIDDLILRFSAEKVSVDTFPSGVVMIRLYLHILSVDMEYNPKQGYGVSLIDPHSEDFNPFGIGHDHVFSTFDEAKTCFLTLVEENSN